MQGSYNGNYREGWHRTPYPASSQCSCTSMPSITPSAFQPRESQHSRPAYREQSLPRWMLIAAGLSLLLVLSFSVAGREEGFAQLGAPASIQNSVNSRNHVGLAHVPISLRLSMHQHGNRAFTKRNNKIIRRSVVEREALDTAKTEAKSQSEEDGNEMSDESDLGSSEGMGSFVQEELIPESEIRNPDGSPVTLEDCLGNFDASAEYPFIDKPPSMPSKWQGVDASLFVDEDITLKEDAEYRDMFGLEPDKDEEFEAIIEMMDKAEAQGVRQQWSTQEEADAPYFSREEMPSLDAEGCLDVLLGTEPDHDPELSELVAEMDKRQGIAFRDENVEDAAPTQSSDPLEILNDLFTDPDPDEERDELFAMMDRKNPTNEVPDFTPVPEPNMAENDQIILLREDQVDRNGLVIDPVLLENDPDLAARQKKATLRAKEKTLQRGKKAARAAGNENQGEDLSTIEKEENSRVESVVTTLEEKKEAGSEAKKVEDLTDEEKLAAQAQLLAQAEARAKEAEDARKKAEQELADIKAKVSKREFKVPDVSFEIPETIEQPQAEQVVQVNTEKKKEVAQSISGYQPPVVAGMPSVDEVQWESEIGEDYEPLRALIRAGEFRKADDWTRAKLVDIAGEAAKKRGWVYFAEVPRIPYKDMKALDDLWRYGTGGKFGYSRQREIYARNGMDLMRMYDAMDWVTRGQDKPCPGCDTLCPTCVTYNYRSWKNNEFIYDINAKDGHLPLTSTLRGNKLLINILDHPAIADNSRVKKIVR